MPRLSPPELASRKLGMGSTDVVEALGLAPWEGAGPMRVYMAKTSLAPEDDPDEAGHLDWGHIQEPVILAWYERTTSARCLPCGQVRHPTHDWLWASLDATVLGESKNVEVKNVGSNMAAHWDSYIEDGVPRYVRAQVTIGMACSGKRSTDVVASVAGRPPHIWTVAYDEELASLLIAGAAAFWEATRNGIAPALDHTDASKAYLLAKYPSNADKIVIDADADAEALGQRRAALSIQSRGCDREIKRIDAELLARIKDHDAIRGVRGNGWKMTWRLNMNGDRRQRFTGAGDPDEQG